MRVALFSNNKAIGLDVMDAENGSFCAGELPGSRAASDHSELKPAPRGGELLTYCTLVGLVAYAAIATDLYLPRFPT
ncbi:MAG: hypothetical protein CM15mP74_08230 [Halieaceae bacterium]|nr:MAG: hypothetical protein CM15mP74_08230 [Halieaceae bacterium]